MNQWEILMEEYKIAWQYLWHADRMEHIRANYLYLIQTGGLLFSTFYLDKLSITSFKYSFVLFSVVVLFIILFTFFINVSMARNREFVGFISAQITDLEARIGVLSTQTRCYEYFKKEPHCFAFPDSGEVKQLKGLARFGSRKIERILPWIFIAFWGIIWLIIVISKCQIIILC